MRRIGIAQAESEWRPHNLGRLLLSATDVFMREKLQVVHADGPTRYLRRGWRFSLEVVCSDDGCFLLDACWKCGAVLDPLSFAVPCTEFLCCKCSAPLAKAPSIRFSETLKDQAKLYDDLQRRLSDATSGFAEFRFCDFIQRLSAGDLRGTNPTNAADRHTAVMLEAWELRRGPQPGTPAIAGGCSGTANSAKIKVAAGKPSKKAMPKVRTISSRQSASSPPSVKPARQPLAG